MLYSAFQYNYLWLPLFGLIVGLLASMIGSGGGLFFPLILMLLFATPPPVAVGTSLAAILPLCIVALLGHRNSGNIDVRLGAVFGISGVAGALAGVGITRLLGPELLGAAFGAYTMLLGVLMVPARRTPRTQGSGMVTGSLYGFAGGVISGSFGTSGTAPVLAGLFALRLPLKVVVGTSLLVVLIKTVAALAGHLLFGKIDLTLVLLLTPGTVLGAFVGPRLLARVDIESQQGWVRRIFAVIVVLLGLFMMIRWAGATPGGSLPVY